jgi:membrane fusion protein, multidrug efflux system
MKRNLLLFILGALTLYIGCGTQAENAPVPQKANAKLVKVQPVTTRTLVETLRLPGTLQAENIANILSTVEGKISKLQVREGDHVEANAVVAMISSLVREDIINSARLLVQAKQEALMQNPDDPQLVKELQQAQQDYQFAMQQYKEIPVTSPISGVVSQRFVDLGDMIPAKARLFEIQSGSNLLAHVPVSEIDIRKFKIGQSVDITADAYADRKFTGVIQRIHPQMDVQTRTGMVEIRLTSHDPNLLAGMFVRAMFVTQTRKNVVAIPVSAIIDRPQHRTCFVVNEQKAEERIVQTGLEADGWVEIIDGLSTGEQVVIEGQQQLKTGTPVKIQTAGNKK